jgi:uncharacterized protein YfaP (DUF2135 family)
VCLSLQADLETRHDATLSPLLWPGQSRMVLTWGEEPANLDLHLLAPHADADDGSCEVDFEKRRICPSKSVQLDNEWAKGRGPETFTILSWCVHSL